MSTARGLTALRHGHPGLGVTPLSSPSLGWEDGMEGPQRLGSDQDSRLSSETKPQYLLDHQIIMKRRVLGFRGKNQQPETQLRKKPRKSSCKVFVEKNPP